jgi:predicted dehydrogenase
VRPIRVACFGAGWVTTHRHIPALRADGRFEVVAIVDRRADRARDAADALGIPVYAGGESVLDLPDPDAIDAITCGTAPFAHYDVIKHALERGKHALTEKPFTMSVAEGEDLRDLARARGVQIAVVHNFQFASSVARLDRWLATGRLGTPRAVWAMQLSNPRRRLPSWYDELPLGLFYDESPHMLYLLRHFVDAPLALDGVSVVPSTVRPDTNTPAQITVQYKNDLPATLTMNFEAPISEWHVAVLGEDGMGAVDVFRDIAVFTPNDGRHGAPSVLRTSLAGTFRHWAGHLRSGTGHLRGRLLYGNDVVVGRFADAVHTGVPPRGISVDDALAVLQSQHDIIVAADLGLGQSKSP